MKTEYDFSKMRGTVRGKYYRSYRDGHTVKIRKKNARISVRRCKPDEGSVVLAPDVLHYFPDSESVNSALRTLIRLIPQKRRKVAKRRAA